MKAVFDDETFGFRIDDEVVSALEAKGASAAIARDSQSNIAILMQRLQSDIVLNGGISKSTREIQDTYDAFKRETKLMQMAEFALANGGIDQVTDWTRAEEIIAEQWNGNDDFKGARAFFEDIEKGRYGTRTLNNAGVARGLAYTSSGRLTYENERLAARMQKVELEAKRETGGVERHCGDCPSWAALGWIAAADMFEKYAIGMSRCVYNCYCVIVTRKKSPRTLKDMVAKALKDTEEAEKKSLAKAHWYGLPTVLKAAAIIASQDNAKRAASFGVALVTVIGLFKYSRNPRAATYALGLLKVLLNANQI
ncbi:hypothetical protein EON80_26865 [bacterium]|nr:MAG: hypothetical protein EON80_26865 [bacterium]